MKRVRSVLLAAVLASLAVAQDPAAGAMDKVRSLEQQFTELTEQVQQDFAGLERLPEGEREAAGDRIFAAYQEAAGKVADQLVEIATADHGAVGLAAIGAALGTRLNKAQRASVIEMLAEHHVATAGIGQLLPRLRYVSGKSVDALLRKVIGDNPAKAAKGTATFVLAQRGKDETLFEQCIADFADVAFGDDTIGQLATRQLFALRNLKIGGTAPDIVGQDMDGAAFKLSDYLGKVVLLDFWGFW